MSTMGRAVTAPAGQETKTERKLTGPPALPCNNRAYGSQEYWENRFTSEESFEWLLSYEQLAPQLEPIFSQRGVRILVVGCGNAPFSADLYDAGYTQIVNIDYAPAVIAAMRARHAAVRPAMEWRVMDMTAMDALGDASFDVVIDKAAMDALMTAEGDVWHPAESVIAASHRMCGHIARILKKGGTFVQISLAQPHFRKKYLLGSHAIDEINGEVAESSADSYSDKFGWSYRSEPVGRSDEAGGFGHYLYIMTNQPKDER